MIRRFAVSFGSGLVFAIGLGIAGMTRPAKVLAFLDVTGAWDPSLALVMVSAIAVTFAVYRVVLRRPAPLFAPDFGVPGETRVDARLVTGSIVFGAGWGLAGFCPGPAVVATATGAGPVLLFVAAMLVGMKLYSLVQESPAPGASSGTLPRTSASRSVSS